MGFWTLLTLALVVVNLARYVAGALLDGVRLAAAGALLAAWALSFTPEGWGMLALFGLGVALTARRAPRGEAARLPLAPAKTPPVERSGSRRMPATPRAGEGGSTPA
ncbi:MAG: hypothetical protein HY719_05110 [Planctomycetes bacterium]|nr:hypothetical protein [Planctomycetota bacterium]